MRTEQAHSFDAIAEDYDRRRPSYPDALYHDLFETIPLASGARVLEIGAGSGIASVPVARRGFALDCLEPGTRLSAVLRGKLGGFPDCAVYSATFEDWDLLESEYALVYSAQAFHWLDPESRFARAASALAQGGALAVFGNAQLGVSGPDERALLAAYAAHAPNLAGPSPTRWYAKGGPVPDLFRSSGCFSEPMVRYYDWSLSYGSDEYLALLRTHSDYRLLSEETRERLLSAIGSAIDSSGGRIEVLYQSSLCVARCITVA